MSGFVKAKEFDWKDSNMALFGSDTDRKVKKDSAETEPAWKGAGQKPGLQIWRINQFKVDHQPKDDYGTFFDGDSYIILNTYKEQDSDALLYDVHFWIGKNSTQDEYGTAAYKTVELDTLLDDKPVQHREVMGHETAVFKSYFKSLTILTGGNDTGFRHVKPGEYKVRLLHVRKKDKDVTVTEVSPDVKKLNDDDVFIIDNGNEIYQWNGSNSHYKEKREANQKVQSLKGQRGKAEAHIIDHEEGRDIEDEIREILDDGSSGELSETDGAEEQDDCDTFPGRLLKVSDAGGKVQRTVVSEGSIPRNALDSNDVFIADTGKEVFVWVGKRASKDELKNGLPHAHNYLTTTKHPCISITVLKEGQETREFEQILD